MWCLQVPSALTGPGCRQGRTVRLMWEPEGRGVQEVGFITVQMTKPPVLRLQEGIDAVPSGECPPHLVTRRLVSGISSTMTFPDGSPQAGALICLEAWVIGAEPLFRGWAWGFQARSSTPGACLA